MPDLRLKAWRAYRALSQADLAERSGVTKATIVALEKPDHRSPHPRTVRRLAKALEVQPHAMYESPPPPGGVAMKRSVDASRAKRAAIYVRVSSEEQVDGFSLDAVGLDGPDLRVQAEAVHLLLAANPNVNRGPLGSARIN